MKGAAGPGCVRSGGRMGDEQRCCCACWREESLKRPAGHYSYGERALKEVAAITSQLPMKVIPWKEVVGIENVSIYMPFERVQKWEQSLKLLRFGSIHSRNGSGAEATKALVESGVGASKYQKEEAREWGAGRRSHGKVKGSPATILEGALTIITHKKEEKVRCPSEWTWSM